MNRKKFYDRRRVYRIMLGRDSEEHGYPSEEKDKYWSGMQKFEKSYSEWQGARLPIRYGWYAQRSQKGGISRAVFMTLLKDHIKDTYK